MEGTMIIRRSSLARAALVSISLAVLSPLTAAADEPAPAATSSTATAALAPKEAGARYGQALGAAEVCFGSKVTEKAKGLEASYSGADQDAFKGQAAKIFEAWHKVKNCADQVDPNRCKIIMDKSCLAAENEIGANGNVVPGLVDFIKH
jgi:hypothetical protein